MIKRFTILAFLLFCSAENLPAKHIVGGDLTYRRLTGNKFEFTLKLFRDCTNNVAYDDSIKLGIFIQNTNVLFDSLMMGKIYEDSLELSGSTCQNLPPGICVDKAVYIDTIDLPNNINGYYGVWERCCRNLSVTNLIQPQNTGIAFYVKIPNPAIVNSSAYFLNDPFPYMCEQQPFSYNFSAVDPDGDVLTYELATPYAGYLGYPVNAAPIVLAITPNPAPYPLAVWSPPHSLANVCNSTVPLTVNTSTGMMQVVSNTQGIYAMAVIVHEWRGAVEIGLIRREIEFNVIVCSGNNSPSVSFNNINSSNPNVGNGTVNSNTVDFVLYETDSLCFTLSATDSDPMQITYSGEIFPGGPISPPYATTSNATGNGTVTTGFCWKTSCSHSRVTPYRVIYNVHDSGCPTSSTTTDTVNILVNPMPDIPPANMVCMDLDTSGTLQAFYGNTFSPYDNRFFDYYIVYRSANGSPFIAYDTIHTALTNYYYDANAPYNDSLNYCYFLKGVNKCGTIGINSDTSCTLDNINPEVNYITSVTVNNDNEIQINWRHFDDAPFSTFYFNRKENPEAEAYSLYKTIVSPAADTLSDKNVETNKISYCYTLINQDICGNISPQSNEGCSILLNGIAFPLQNNLTWSEYKHWEKGVQRYEVWRKSSNQPSFKLITSLPDSTYLFLDEYLDQDAGKFTYYIKAVGDSANYESKSNEIILEQHPNAFIPSAFTPNNDARNDEWAISSAFIKDFDLTVFNRWGNVVFKTRNKNLRWDGNYQGKPAPQGVYIYVLKYSGFLDFTVKYLRGEVTLMR